MIRSKRSGLIGIQSSLRAAAPPTSHIELIFTLHKYDNCMGDRLFELRYFENLKKL